MRDVTVAMDRHLVPCAQIGRNSGQRAHQGPFDLEQGKRRLARRAVDAASGFLHDPVARLGIEIREVAELAQRQEVALHVLDAGFDDALLGRIGRRAGIDAETVPLGAFGIGALHDRVVSARARDGALGVVDDHAGRHGAEPLEGATVATQPGRDRLVPDELDVLMPRECERHYERPRAREHAVGIRQHRTGAEVDLSRFAGREAQRHGGVGRPVCVDRHDHAIHRRIAAGVAVLAPQGSQDRRAGHALLEP